ncbi:MAG: DUF3226 domain-containing protein [Leptospirales bacterium]
MEDEDTKGAVSGLMKHHIEWGNSDNGWTVFIDKMGSCNEVLKKENLNLRFKQSGIANLGLIIDADSDFTSRWDTVKEICSHYGGNPPEAFPESGLILTLDSIRFQALTSAMTPVRFGVWIMPDNKSQGMIETFCHALVPDDAKPLWSFARDCVKGAQSQGAPFKDIHFDKSHIHTWLAWQDPPGERMGIAFTKKFLDHESPSAMNFVNWFRNLFQV